MSTGEMFNYVAVLLYYCFAALAFFSFDVHDKNVYTDPGVGVFMALLFIAAELAKINAKKSRRQSDDSK